MSTIRRPVGLLGVPFNSSGLANGVARAPGELRRAGLVADLTAAGLDVVDYGDVEPGPTDPTRDPASHVIAPHALATMIRAVRANVQRIDRAGAFPLVLGGDCPIVLGCLGVRASAPPRLIFVDGHEDAWPPRLSTTGEAADMELGFALGLTLDDLPGDLLSEIPHLDLDAVLAIGPRDEQELAEAGVRSIGEIVEIVRADAISEGDPEAIAAAAVSRHAQVATSWLHVDLDMLSTESLGAVDYPQPGGLDWDWLTRFTTRALANQAVIGLDVTIYNPDLDPTGTDAKRIVRYLVESLGG